MSPYRDPTRAPNALPPIKTRAPLFYPLSEDRRRWWFADALAHAIVLSAVAIVYYFAHR